MTALLESQLGLLKQAATSDKTLAEIRGMKEALEEVEAVEREIEETKEEPAIEPAEVLEETTEVEETEEAVEDKVHDFNTKEIEYLLKADE